ncbi:MAG: hypothetical protein MR548_00005 [Prevotella sp.]|nr:hypothetical protein [Prevotella sp.]
MEAKSSLLIIADDDLSYGINQGYYPDMTKAIDLGNLTVCPLSNVDNLIEHDIHLSAQPIGDGEDVYLRNPYANYYVSMKDSNILNTFIETKSYAIKEVLVKMGAKDIVLKESVHDKNTSRYEVNNEMGVNVVKAKINGNYLNEITVDMKSSIESHDPNRKPKPYKEIVDFMESHGLSNESTLSLLAERLKTDGRISGIEKYEVTYCSEIASALKIAASIDYKMFSDNLDFSVEHNNVHIIKKSLEINFG